MKEKMKHMMDGLWTYLCVCVPGVPAYVMSGRELFLPHAIRNSSRPDITQAGTLDTHTHRQHTATYQTDEASRLRK